MIAWTTITKFGDAVVMLPAATAIAAWLFIAGTRRLALYWLALFGIAAALVTLTKIAFVGWGIGIAGLDFTGISGHTTFAMTVIPTLFYLALPTAAPTWRAVGAVAGIACALLIGISRLTLDAHTLSEVVLGCALGLAISLCFIRIARRYPMPRLHAGAAACCIAALIASWYAQAAPTQHWVERVALYLSGHEQPYQRTGQPGQPMPGQPTNWQRESASDLR
jgi:membrane-associated phospholipid phosphatase